MVKYVYNETIKYQPLKRKAITLLKMTLYISGWVIEFRRDLCWLSAKIICPSLSRSKVPSAQKTSSPKDFRILYHDGWPGSTTGLRFKSTSFNQFMVKPHHSCCTEKHFAKYLNFKQIKKFTWNIWYIKARPPQWLICNWLRILILFICFRVRVAGAPQSWTHMPQGLTQLRTTWKTSGENVQEPTIAMTFKLLTLTTIHEWTVAAVADAAEVESVLLISPPLPLYSSYMR